MQEINVTFTSQIISINFLMLNFIVHLIFSYKSFGPKLSSTTHFMTLLHISISIKEMYQLWQLVSHLNTLTLYDIMFMN